MEENKKIRIVKAELYILPVTLRIPLKFGDQVLQSVSCARVKIIIENMIRIHLGWLIVWGGVFGGLFGLLFSIIQNVI